MASLFLYFPRVELYGVASEGRPAELLQSFCCILRCGEACTSVAVFPYVCYLALDALLTQMFLQVLVHLISLGAFVNAFRKATDPDFFLRWHFLQVRAFATCRWHC